jgi:hypothetical protein
MLSLIKLRFCCPPTELDTVLYPANAFGQHALYRWVLPPTSPKSRQGRPTPRFAICHFPLAPKALSSRSR